MSLPLPPSPPSPTPTVSRPQKAHLTPLSILDKDDDPVSIENIPEKTPESISRRHRLARCLKRRLWPSVKHHMTTHVGGGLVASVAYFDPGNWSVDLQAGSLYGYHLLFAVLLAGLSAIVLQVQTTAEMADMLC